MKTESLFMLALVAAISLTVAQEPPCPPAPGPNEPSPLPGHCEVSYKCGGENGTIALHGPEGCANVTCESVIMTMRCGGGQNITVNDSENKCDYVITSYGQNGVATSRCCNTSQTNGPGNSADGQNQIPIKIDDGKTKPCRPHRCEDDPAVMCPDGYIRCSSGQQGAGLADDGNGKKPNNPGDDGQTGCKPHGCEEDPAIPCPAGYVRCESGNPGPGPNEGDGGIKCPPVQKNTSAVPILDQDQDFVWACHCNNGESPQKLPLQKPPPPLNNSLTLRNPIAIVGSLSGAAANVDDDFYPLDLPFPVTVFGHSSTKVFVSVNGLFSLDTGTRLYNYRNLPYHEGDFPSYTLLPFWADLYIYQGTPQGIYYEISGTAPSRTLTVEWYVSRYNMREQYYQFSLAIAESQPGIVTYKYYQALDQGSKCVIGVQGPNTYKTFSFDQPKVNPGVQVVFDTGSSDSMTESTFTP